MHIDRRAFLATLGSAAVVEAMSSEARADALEHYMMAQLDKPAAPSAQPLVVRRGAGALFGGPSPSGQRPELTALATMPERPTLVDFIRLRGTPGIGNHILQSANDAQRKGEAEETVLACLLHDIAVNLIKVDHGWWAAQMVEPYVSEKVSWAIRYHQALRFFPDPSVGYGYPERYVQIFGEGYMPERPTLVDFIRFRGTPGIGNHILQSANDALRKGESEETVLACLLHDFVLNLMKPDHGGARS